MGYCISGNDESMDQRLNIWGWHSLLSLAFHFGWEPQGTVMKDWKDHKTGELVDQFDFDPEKHKDGEWVNDEDWDGTYFSNYWQEITADDAKNLAEALEQALEYMSDKTEDQIEDDIKNWSGLGAQEVVKDCINLFKSGSCVIA